MQCGALRQPQLRGTDSRKPTSQLLGQPALGNRICLERTSLFEASRTYLDHDVPALIFAGEEYGTGSSRDWAAKGTRLLGVCARQPNWAALR